MDTATRDGADGARSYTRSRGRAARGPRPTAGAVDSDLRARHRHLPCSRARTRDRGRVLLRRGGQDQRLHGRLPGAESLPLAGRRRGPLLGVRPRLQRAAGEGRAQARLARRLKPFLADAARARWADGASDRLRPAGDRALRRPRWRRGPGSRPLARALPDRRAARSLRSDRRDPEQLRPVHRPRAGAGVLEPGDHRRARARRPARQVARREALRLRHLDRDRHGDPGPPALALAARPRRPASDGPRLARPGDQARLHADGAGDDRARPDQLQPRRRLDLRFEADRPEPRADRDRQGLPHLHAPAGDVLGRSGDRALPVALTARDARGPGRLPPHGRRRPAADRVPARPGERLLGCSGRADRPLDLRARRVQLAADARGRSLIGRLCGGPHLQRDDAVAEPGLLQPAVALAADGRCSGQPSPQRPPRLGLLRLRHLGHPPRDDRREHRGHGRAARVAAPSPRADRAEGEHRSLRPDRARLRGARRSRVRILACPRRGARTLVGRADRLGRRRARGGHARLRVVLPCAGSSRAPGVALAAQATRHP